MQDMYSIWEWLAQYKNAIIADNRLDDGSLDSARLIDFFTRTYRSYYRLYWNFASVKRCFARFPVYMIWVV